MRGFINNQLYHTETLIRSLVHETLPERSRKYLLASFPRSGNTWIRFVIANAIKKNTDGPEVNFHTLASYVPDPPYSNSKGNCCPDDQPLFLKTHSPYIRAFESLPCFVIFRNPLDALLSLIEYLEGEYGKGISNAKMLKSYRSGASAWTNFHRSWIKAGAHFLNYDELVRNPEAVLGSAFRSVGVLLSESSIAYGIGQSSKTRMRESRLVNGDPHARSASFDFVRTSDSIRDRGFSREEALFIEATCGETYAELKNGLVR